MHTQDNLAGPRVVPQISVSLGVLGGLSQAEKGPLRCAYEMAIFILTEHWDLDTIHRRQGGDGGCGWNPKRSIHGDNHRYCTGNCSGRGAGTSSGGNAWVSKDKYKQRKITAWRKARAAKNRQYLEEYVYDNAQGQNLEHNAIQRKSYRGGTRRGEGGGPRWTTKG